MRAGGPRISAGGDHTGDSRKLYSKTPHRRSRITSVGEGLSQCTAITGISRCLAPAWMPFLLIAAWLPMGFGLLACDR